MNGISVATDGGPAVASIFDNPDDYIGKKIGISGAKLSGDEYAAILSKVTGKTIKFSYIPPDAFAKLPFPGAEDLAVMFEFYDYISDQSQNVEITRKLIPNTTGFEKWAEQNKDRILSEEM